MTRSLIGHRVPTLQRLTRYFTAVLAMVGLAVVVISVTPIVSWWAYWLAGPWDDPAGDVLIVLGGAADVDGTMAQNSYLRATYAARAYRDGGFRQVVVSGGPPDQSIARAMGDYLQYLGISRNAIYLEQDSLNTHENALYCKALLNRFPGRKVLMTSDYHMLRAARAFRKIGLDVVPRPFPDAIKRSNSFENRWGAFVDVLRETIAVGYYFARGWI